MKECKLCNRAMSDSRKSPICARCTKKVAAFAKKSLIGAGSITACALFMKSKEIGVYEIKEFGKKVPVVEASKAVKRAGENLKENIETGFEKTELRLKGLSGDFAVPKKKSSKVSDFFANIFRR